MSPTTPPAPSPATQPSSSAPGAGDDPHLWLEEVDGQEALRWVAERNAEATDALGGPELEAMQAEILQVLDSADRIPMVTEVGGYLYNLWRDADHERGLWRRTTLEEYRTASPTWDVLLDLDALADEEGVSWVWHGASVLRPDCTRALVDLSPGGQDADVTREFDLTTRTWVEDGFVRPEAKGGVGWIDRDTVFVTTDTGPGSTTTSGYPRQARRWRRGTPLDQAPVVGEVAEDDLAVWVSHDRTPGFERDLLVRAVDFYHQEVNVLGPDDELVPVPVPSSAEVSIKREWLLVELREPWSVGGQEHPAGSLLAVRLEEFLAGGRDLEVLFAPTQASSLAGYTWTRHHLVLTVLEDVQHHAQVCTPTPGGWATRALDTVELGAPPLATVSVAGVDSDESDDLWVTSTGFTTPTTLSRVTLGADGSPSTVEHLKQAPAFFEPDHTVTQHMATSDDGTRVPYFLVTPNGATGPVPTLLYGYGGFEISLTPTYAGGMGRAWLSRGGAYVVANIRGGGEYGPRWHQAALKDKRHRAYEDFAAVARDLVERGVTTTDRLGIQGGSNGGLLMGAMLTLYPQLVGAVVCQVPLLDMSRYHRLLAGASWVAEYGDPEDPAQWEYIRTFSPYHQLREDQDYPPVLFTTSTRDDRVHPGHARKMAARMLQMGKDVLSYENIEGGHGGAATNAQAAHMAALAYRFLWLRLGRPTGG